MNERFNHQALSVDPQAIELIDRAWGKAGQTSSAAAVSLSWHDRPLTPSEPSHTYSTPCPACIVLSLRGTRLEIFALESVREGGDTRCRRPSLPKMRGKPASFTQGRDKRSLPRSLACSPGFQTFTTLRLSIGGIERCYRMANHHSSEQGEQWRRDDVCESFTCFRVTPAWSVVRVW